MSSRPNFFRFKRKYENSSPGSSSGGSNSKQSRLNSKNKSGEDPGKVQTSISKFFLPKQRGGTKKANGAALSVNGSDDNIEIVTDTSSHQSDEKSSCGGQASSTPAAVSIVPRTLAPETLDKLRKFSSASSAALRDRDTCVTKPDEPSDDKPITKTPSAAVSNGSPAELKVANLSGIQEKWKRPPTSSQSLSTGNSSKSTKDGAPKYTPFEQQVVDFKNQYPGMILVIESGYKYRFFGEDAKIASEVLNIMVNQDHNFLTASIPTHRLHVHVRRLVENGHKVGVIKQTETTALKKSNMSTKNTIFTRQLDAVYTKSTLIGENVDVCKPPEGSADDEDGFTPAESLVCSMACIAEKPYDNKRLCDIGVVVLEPATGEAIFTSFVDHPNRAALEKILLHTRPVEVIVPNNISSFTENLLNNCQISIEKLPERSFDYSEGLLTVSDFMAEDCKARLGDMDPCAVSALAAMIKHLQDFGLSKALSPKGLKPFTEKDTILQMDAGTVKNMELFESGLDKNKGSLFWVLDHTKTSFGSRMLRRWISQPLCTLEPLLERQDAVAELLRPEVSELATQLRAILTKLPDLEKDLTCVLHGKITTAGFGSLLSCLAELFKKIRSMEIALWSIFNNDLIESLFKEIAENLEGILSYSDNFNFDAAKEGDKTKLLKDWSAFPEVVKQINLIKKTTTQLDELRPKIAKTLGRFSVNYTKVSGIEYLIEVKVKEQVPRDWAKISSTKQLDRWRPPEVASIFSELCRHRELLAAACQSAWLSTLQNFAQDYHTHKVAIKNLATLDALLSLAHVSKQDGYCRPVLQDGKPLIEIVNGRHPILSNLFTATQEVVANDASLGGDHERCIILTGPNMGGKSSYIRQTALLVIMAQIGCSIPAEKATISLVDAIFTRMGSRDELQHGRSTLLVELEEASLILSRATSRSLAVLDELGRGTSSCDGAAIAVATLHHIVTKVQCLTLFVTHYPIVMTLEQQFPKLVRNYHMGFSLLETEGLVPMLTFLYKVEPGGAQLSYGINVARLADLPSHILVGAAEKASQLQQQVVARNQKCKKLQRLWHVNSAQELKEVFQT